MPLEKHSAASAPWPLSGPALAAWVSLPFLLVWVTGVGVALGRPR